MRGTYGREKETDRETDQLITDRNRERERGSGREGGGRESTLEKEQARAIKI